jgi:hypothetical protein
MSLCFVVFSCYKFKVRHDCAWRCAWQDSAHAAHVAHDRLGECRAVLEMNKGGTGAEF